MKYALVLLAFAVPALSQAPIYMAPTPDYLGPIYRALATNAQLGFERQKLNTQAAMEQQKINLARERLRLEEREAGLQPPSWDLSYREVHPNESALQIKRDVSNAIKACRHAHSDCKKLEGAMNVISPSLHPDWTRTSMTEYVECLYVIARYATFAEPVRQALLKPSTAAAAH